MGLFGFLTNAATILSLSKNSSISTPRIRQDIASKATLIASPDTLIAGHAIGHGLSPVTGNTRVFSHTEGLKLENWVES
ncbi:hypothetical protein HZ994_04885 [Akkermansiaceae bacterium]|nr:hypothetical protein HZ994_04885 [Akkermansiaceae bacterium]